MRFPAVRLVAVCALAAVLVCGCGSSESFDVAPVRGKVLSNGEPVSEGIVQFAPDGGGPGNPGKSAMGVIEAGGEFVLTTYKTGDGAVIGRGRLTAGSTDPLKPWPAELKGPVEYEVKSGANEIVIDISPDGTGKVSSAGGRGVASRG